MFNFPAKSSFVKKFFLLWLLLPASLSCATTIKDWFIFKQWHKYQFVYSDYQCATLESSINDAWAQAFKHKLDQHWTYLQSMTPFLQAITHDQIDAMGYCIETPINPAFAETIKKIYNDMDNNIPTLIRFFKKNNFCSSSFFLPQDTQRHLITIETYKRLAELLFPQLNAYEHNKVLFALANHFFEYCFDPATFSQHKKLLQNADYYPIVTFIYSIMWYALVNNGWQDWHANCLNQLKQEADQGKTIIYLAGGTDIYELINQGIYNIRVIDPFLPHQERFYTTGWRWLIQDEQGELGDIILFNAGKKKVYLKRVSHIQREPFLYKHPNNAILKAYKTITTWEIYDANHQKQGTVTFDRRPFYEQDIRTTPNTVVVLSYNSAMHIAAPDDMDGWGIDIASLDPACTLHIKQLRKPITKEHLAHMRITIPLCFHDLEFINLATNPL